MEHEGVKYTNKIVVIANQDKSEVIVNLYQEVPAFDLKTNTVVAETAQVGSFVMNKRMAEELVRIVAGALNGDANESKVDKE